MKLLFLLAALLTLALAPSTASACSCAYTDPPAAFNRARAVFIGRVVDGTKTVKIASRDGKARVVIAGSVRFAVETWFKGDASSEVTVAVDSHEETSCGPYGLKRGERYVVYAYAEESEPSALYTGVCTRTKPANTRDAKDDLSFLQNLPAPGSGGSIRGFVGEAWRDNADKPLADVTITVRASDGSIRTVKTGVDGTFVANGLEAGTYRVEPDYPAHRIGSRAFENVTVEDRGAVDVSFHAMPDARIAGRILDRDGVGFETALVLVKGAQRNLSGRSNGADGAFEVSGVPPGEYVVFLELRGADGEKIVPWYYPGTFDRIAATVVRIDAGRSTEGLDFRLPADYRVRTIEGRVLGPDGKPAPNAQVNLLCPRAAERTGLVVELGPLFVWADEKGRFRIQALAGEVYWVEARGVVKSGDGRSAVEVYSPSLELVVTDDVKGLTLDLSLVGPGGRCPD